MSKPVFDDLLTFSGRRNRQSFLLFSLAWWGAVLFSLVVYGALVGLGAIGEILVVMFSVVFVTVVVLYYVAAAQRCRDFGWTGWSILLSLVPFIGWIFAVVIYFIPGTDGPNRYGPDPLIRSSGDI